MTLNENIKYFYDKTSPLWLDVWGEHMHHGYYGPNSKPNINHQEAQIDLLDRLLEWAEIKKANNILDAGCGVGGSARFLAKRFEATVTGCTLSSVQAERAALYNEKAGLSNRVDIRVQDMMTLGNEPQKFDFIWSLESAEHIAQKTELLQMFHNLMTDDGKLLLVTWCTRAPVEELDEDEKALLEKIYKNYHLPPMIPMYKYAEAAEKIGFKNIETADWTEEVAPFWKAVIKSAFSWKSVVGLVKAGPPALRGAWTMRYMTEGYQRGLLKFALLKADK